MRYSPDGTILAVAGSIGIWLYDINSNKEPTLLTTDMTGAYNVSFSPHGQMLATTSGDHTVRVWDALTGTHQKTFKGHTADINDAAFSPDGRTIVSWSNDRTIRLWDVDTGKFKEFLQFPKSSEF